MRMWKYYIIIYRLLLLLLSLLLLLLYCYCYYYIVIVIVNITIIISLLPFLLLSLLSLLLYYLIFYVRVTVISKAQRWSWVLRITLVSRCTISCNYVYWFSNCQYMLHCFALISHPAFLCNNPANLLGNNSNMYRQPVWSIMAFFSTKSIGASIRSS